MTKDELTSENRQLRAELHKYRSRCKALEEHLTSTNEALENCLNMMEREQLQPIENTLINCGAMPPDTEQV